MRGQIGEPGQVQHVGECAVAIVRHDRTAAALWMVVLASRKAIVDDQQRAGFAALREAAHQRLRGRIDLARVIAVGREECARGLEQASRAKRTFGQHQATAIERDAALVPRVASTHDHVRRHGVEHLVGDEDAAPALGQHIDPFHARQQRRHLALQMRTLPVAQIGTDFEQPVARRQGVARGQCRQHVGGEPTGTRAEFEDVAGHVREDIGNLRRQRTTEQRRKLRCGDEVAVPAESCACLRRSSPAPAHTVQCP